MTGRSQNILQSSNHKNWGGGMRFLQARHNVCVVDLLSEKKSKGAVEEGSA